MTDRDHLSMGPPIDAMPHPNDAHVRCVHALAWVEDLWFCSTHSHACGVMCPDCARAHAFEFHRSRMQFASPWPMRTLTLVHGTDEITLHDVLLRLIVDY